jgi:hypothetical protein
MAGRPSKYDKVIKDQLNKIMELAAHGFTDEEISRFVGIATSTYYEYLKKHPEFSESIKRGKINADNEVTKSSYKLCTGFEVIEETLEYVPGSGDSKTTVKQVKKVRKYFPPNITAIIWWQSNRQGDRWRNKKYEIGSEDINNEKVPEFDDMSDAELTKFIDKETKANEADE